MERLRAGLERQQEWKVKSVERGRKKTGEKTLKELVRSRARREMKGKQTRSVTGGQTSPEPECDENPSRNKRGNEKPTPSWSNNWSSLSLATQGLLVPAAHQQMLLVSCPHKPTPSPSESLCLSQECRTSHGPGLNNHRKGKRDAETPLASHTCLAPLWGLHQPHTPPVCFWV